MKLLYSMYVEHYFYKRFEQYVGKGEGNTAWKELEF